MSAFNDIDSRVLSDHLGGTWFHSSIGSAMRSLMNNYFENHKCSPIKINRRVIFNIYLRCFVNVATCSVSCAGWLWYLLLVWNCFFDIPTRNVSGWIGARYIQCAIASSSTIIVFNCAVRISAPMFCLFLLGIIYISFGLVVLLKCWFRGFIFYVRCRVPFVVWIGHSPNVLLFDSVW